MLRINDAVMKLLPKTWTREAEREEPLIPPSRRTVFFNAALACTAAFILAFLLMPRLPHLAEGDLATQSIISPAAFTLAVTMKDGSVQTLRMRKGELVVAAGHRVTDRAERILRAIEQQQRFSASLQAWGGLVLLTLALLYIFSRDIKRYRPALIGDRKKLFLIVFLLLLTVAGSLGAKYIFAQLADKLHLDSVTIAFLLPVAAGSMLMTMLFDFHLALGFSFLVSILLGLAFQRDPFIPVYFFLGSIVAALSVIQCRKRTAVLRAGGLTGLVNLVIILGIDLNRGELAIRAPYQLPAGFLGAIAVTMIVSATLPFFETVFDVATDIKLLELLDPNHPLLKSLVYTCPGTYHHSIMIGNLAEAAAEAIGANPILARVGAYYHDIGKMDKPEYFIENQRPAENKHDRLAPSMSSLIISSHVKEGVELARKHRLPSAVIDIIRQHHGTSLISYFYQKAREQQPLVPVSEQEYRYLGPRPRTKVAAIVMLADAVEAASRTLDNPTYDRIQGLTNSVVTRIFLDNQLSQCDLTLKDLRVISKSFIFVLTGIFHHRIDYPGIDFGEKKRSDHPNKKQPEEKKTSDGRQQGKAPHSLADVRRS